MRSTFGTQCLASMKSAPSCGFGSSVRDAGLKVLHTSVHAPAASQKPPSLHPATAMRVQLFSTSETTHTTSVVMTKNERLTISCALCTDLQLS
jgi:hypothetical protein